jgi:hypothetical protein
MIFPNGIAEHNHFHWAFPIVSNAGPEAIWLFLLA